MVFESSLRKDSHQKHPARFWFSVKELARLYHHALRMQALIRPKSNACKLNRLGREDFLLGGSILITGSC